MCVSLREQRGEDSSAIAGRSCIKGASPCCVISICNDEGQSLDRTQLAGASQKAAFAEKVARGQTP